MRYFDYWLKGVTNGVMDEAPVRVQVRTGNGAHFVLNESEWPIARTRYRLWYLDARPSDWQTMAGVTPCCASAKACLQRKAAPNMTRT